MTLKALLEFITASLHSAPSLAARGPLAHEADILVNEAWVRCAQDGPVLAVPSRLEQRLNLDRIEVPEQVERLAKVWTDRRAQGELLQHILRNWHFLDHSYEVGPQVLVPRPETELLVQCVGDELVRAFPRSAEVLGAEIGLGSGIISIELLSRFPNLRMVASDVSIQALETARSNALRILGQDGGQRLEAYQTDARSSPTEEIRARILGVRPLFLVSNPPYLDPAPESGEVETDVRAQEPALALFAPAGDLLYFYRDIADQAPYLLEKGGFVGVEIPHERAGSLRELFESRGFRVELCPDLTGRNRVLMAWPSQA